MYTKKGALFNLLHMHIIHDIDIWMVGPEYSGKVKAVVMRIKSPRNLVLRMRAYKE